MMDKELTFKYDTITALSFNEVLSFGKNLSEYKVKGIDPSNKEHLFLLTIMKYTNSIYNLDLYLSINPFRYWKLRKKIKLNKVKPTLKRMVVYSADEIIHSIYEKYVPELSGITLTEIYETYYEV